MYLGLNHGPGGELNAAMFFFAVDVANVVCAILFGLRILTARPRDTTAQLIALITLCTICYVVLARYDYAYWIPPPYRVDVGRLEPFLNLGRNTTPGLFMILIHRLFADEKRFPRWLLALFALQLFCEEPVRLFVGADTAAFEILTQYVPTAFETLFAGFAIYWTVKNWRADLVEERRRMRVAVAVLISVNVVVSSLLLRVVIPWNSHANYATYLGLSLANLAIIVLLLLWLKTEDLGPYFGIETEKAPPSPDAEAARRAEDAAALARLAALLEGERVYREPGLTLASLATRVGLPEYRLRRLIHEELGYRNFNAFLHDYRVKDACAQLCDPAMRRIPVLTIALSVGYQSVNTFNRGFREVMGTTPSAYRGENLSPKPE